MNYQETLDYLYRQLPMYQRVGKAAYKVDLQNTIDLCNLLGNPQENLPAIHLAGTNGKGSTAHIMASILQEAGYKTGLYTSPHLKDFRERIKINGKEIPEQEVVDFVGKYQKGFEKIQPSFFEMTVGMAFTYFKKEKVDIAIIEAGLGGRLDSTNIITPLVSVITNIGFDHTQFLGNTLEKIAQEKAGIIKADTPVVIGESQPETTPVFIDTAKAKNAPILFADQQKLTTYVSDLSGPYQQKNIQTAVITLQQLPPSYTISEVTLQKGIKSVIKNTGLQGRWQQLSENPKVICDCGHNKEGLEIILNKLENTPHRKLHIVLGMVNDKNVEKVLEMFPENATYYFCQANIPRALEVDKLASLAKKAGLQGNSHPSVQEALTAAKKNTKKDDLIFVGGSTFVVAEVVD